MGLLNKAPLAQESAGANPTDREKNGSKRHLLAGGPGVPLSLVVTGGNRHDVTQLQAVLDGCEIEDKGKGSGARHLCADTAYTSEPARQSIQERGYLPHVKERG